MQKDNFLTVKNLTYEYDEDFGMQIDINENGNL